MKKFNISFSFILFIIFSININVMAKDIIEEKPKQPNKNSTCTTKKANEKYNPIVNLDEKNKKIEYSINDGVIKVDIFKITFSGDKQIPVLLKSTILGENGTNKSGFYKYDNSNESLIIDIVFSIYEDDNICNRTTGNLSLDSFDGEWKLDKNESTYLFYTRTQVWQDVSNGLVPNSTYNSICKAFRDGDWDSYSKLFTSVGLDKDDFIKYGPSKVGHNAYTNKFSHCYNSRVKTDYRDKEVALMIKNNINGYKIKINSTSGFIKGKPNIEDLIVIPNIDSTDLSKNPLKCPAYINNNNKLVPNLSDTIKRYYVYEKVSSGLKTTSTGRKYKCEKECEELVTVKYGPPVSSKAGLCFEYRVKVESEVNCKTDFIADEPQISDYVVCDPEPVCIHQMGSPYEYTGSMAGPNDEFDNCVIKCDGGKYSDKCVKKCYNQIYSNKNTSFNINNFYNEYNVLKIKNKYDDILDNPNVSANQGEELRKAAIERGKGYYYIAGGEIYWSQGDKYWEKPGRTYLTVYTEGAINGLASRFITTDDGFIRLKNGDRICNAICTWEGCNKAKNNAYYYGKDADNNEFINYSDAVDVYNMEWKEYEDIAKKCRASSKCSTTTAEYTISINNKLNGKKDKDNWFKFETSIKQGGFLQPTTLNGNQLKGSSIVLEKDGRDGCYLEKSDLTNYYMTEWSFPGTWINNKTGKISYNKPSIDNAWKLKTEKFCTNLNSKDVNTSWWVDKVLHENENITNPANIDEYNINATVKNFGLYDWAFNIDCFYALYDKYENPNANTAKDKLDYKIRNVKLNNLFPDNIDEEENGHYDEAGRTPGFNWSNNATNIKNKDYLITPEPLYQEIQKRGNSIYNIANNNKYLDYEFKLGPKELNDIRKYSKELGNNYNNFGGRIKVNNGISYYESNLFRGSNYLDSSSILNLGKLGVNNQNGNSNSEEIFTNEYINTLIENRKDYLESK